MLKPIAVTLLCLTSFTGCASLISKTTGNAPIGLESGTRSLGQALIDSSIERTAKVNLYKLDSRFNQARINIESFHGHVLLTGQVLDANLKQLAEDNLRAMSDVKSVHNYITVGTQIGYSTIMQDTTTTTRVRALLVQAKNVADNKVKVHTENGVLYLMGRLTVAEIEDLNAILQRVNNVNRIVSLVDNLEAAQQLKWNNLATGSTPQIVETPVAIDYNQAQ